MAYLTLLVIWCNFYLPLWDLLGIPWVLPDNDFWNPVNFQAWFRELPTGVLDSLTAEQVMHCNTEEECTRLVKLLPQTEAALLDWAINLMADIVDFEHYNKMNARNIAMVFAPNMTQVRWCFYAINILDFACLMYFPSFVVKFSSQLHKLCLFPVFKHFRR